MPYPPAKHWIVMCTLLGCGGALITALARLLEPVLWQGVDVFVLAAVTVWFAVENWSLLHDYSVASTSLDAILERAESRSSTVIERMLQQNASLSAQNTSLTVSNMHLLESLRCFQGLTHGVLRWQMLTFRLRALSSGRDLNRLARARLVHCHSHP